MNRPSRLIHKLIPNHFPELRGTEIRTEVKRSEGAYLFCVPSGDQRCWYLIATPIVATLPQRIVNGGLAHELAHVAKDQERIKKGTWEQSIKGYKRSRLIEAYEEISTDLDVIRRGLGGKLLAFAEWQLEKQEGLWDISCGLHPDEIIDLLTGKADRVYARYTKLSKQYHRQKAKY